MSTALSPGCGFCKKNKESEAFYMSHKLRDENHRIACPVLARYTCPNCKLTGKHTASYCPRNKPAKEPDEARPSARRSLGELRRKARRPGALAGLRHHGAQEAGEAAKLLAGRRDRPSELDQLPAANIAEAKLENLIQFAGHLAPDERVPMFLKLGYNAARLIRIQEFAYIIEYTIIRSLLAATAAA